MSIDITSLCQELINRASVTPDDAGCQALLTKHLERLGFKLTHLPCGDVKNLWAQRGEQKPLIVFAGHTDVVPPGPTEDWQSPPFTATIRDGYLYGRGAADMKSGLVTMLHASEQFIKKHPQHQGSIGFMITSNEEGDNIGGTPKIVEYLQQQNIQPQYCVVGEASSVKKIADTVKIGRRGSLHGDLTIYGKQGHIAYPDQADNPIHHSLSVLQQLCELQWDNGNEHFPPTAFQISNIASGVGALNVIPGSLSTQFNFRFSTAITAEQIKQRLEKCLHESGLTYDIKWQLSGNPFYTQPGELTQAAINAITDTCGYEPKLSTSGGTSDGRFIAPMGCQVIEIGPCNATIHQSNECVKLDDLEALSRIYEQILRQILI